jgi:hypothetical protein
MRHGKNCPLKYKELLIIIFKGLINHIEKFRVDVWKRVHNSLIIKIVQ